MYSARKGYYTLLYHLQLTLLGDEPTRYLRNQRFDPAGLTCRYVPPESGNLACLRSGGQTALRHLASVSMGVHLRAVVGVRNNRVFIGETWRTPVFS